MGYYYGAGDCRYGRGDYYSYVRPRGDYYRGDPGLFDFVKKIGGAIIKRSPFGLAAEAAKNVLPIFSHPSSRFDPATQGLPPPALREQTKINLFPPGYEHTVFNGGGAPMTMMGKTGYTCAVQGKRGHPNKSGYWTRDGQFHPKGSTCVGPRRMNVANARALRRALRRAQGFAKLARRYMAVSHRFKKAKRRRRR